MDGTFWRLVLSTWASCPTFWFTQSLATYVLIYLHEKDLGLITIYLEMASVIWVIPNSRTMDCWITCRLCAGIKEWLLMSTKALHLCPSIWMMEDLPSWSLGKSWSSWCSLHCWILQGEVQLTCASKLIGFQSFWF